MNMRAIVKFAVAHMLGNVWHPFAQIWRFDVMQAKLLKAWRINNRATVHIV